MILIRNALDLKHRTPTSSIHLSKKLEDFTKEDFEECIRLLIRETNVVIDHDTVVPISPFIFERIFPDKESLVDGDKGICEVYGITLKLKPVLFLTHDMFYMSEKKLRAIDFCFSSVECYMAEMKKIR